MIGSWIWVSVYFGGLSVAVLLRALNAPVLALLALLLTLNVLTAHWILEDFAVVQAFWNQIGNHMVPSLSPGEWQTLVGVILLSLLDLFATLYYGAIAIVTARSTDDKTE